MASRDHAGSAKTPMALLLTDSVWLAYFVFHHLAFVFPQESSSLMLTDGEHNERSWGRERGDMSYVRCRQAMDEFEVL